IVNSLSPQEIHAQMMNPQSTFWKEMVDYLESVHQGEFIDKTMTEVQNDVAYAASDPDYKDPTQTLPEAPPYPCNHQPDVKCHNCTKCDTWWQSFKNNVNDLLYRSNIHSCGDHCTVKGECKAKFPRPYKTTVDEKVGYIILKKLETRLNTFTTTLTYLLRSNPDVTSLLSGTALKSVAAYVTDYITETPLKTYTIFQTICDVFNCQTTMIGGTLRDQEKARKLPTQIVNSLSVRMEMGAPMAAAYLLGNPDHYTSHRFRTVYWKSYSSEVLKDWDSTDLDQLAENDNPNPKDQVVVKRSREGYTAYTPIMDYIYRPKPFKDVCLYDWIHLSRKKLLPNIASNSDASQTGTAVEAQEDSRAKSLIHKT
ncbi:hypothetical protein GLOTRDRAFT_41465, partial [Gloeophyllum trabeum ATCC 11539]